MITSGKFWISIDFVNKIGYNEYNNEGTWILCLVQVKCEPQPYLAGYKCIGEQMLLATLLATNKWVGGQMLIIVKYGGYL